MKPTPQKRKAVDDRINDARRRLNSVHADSWDIAIAMVDDLATREDARRRSADDGHSAGTLAKIAVLRAWARTRAERLREFAEFDDLPKGRK